MARQAKWRKHLLEFRRSEGKARDFEKEALKEVVSRRSDFFEPESFEHYRLEAANLGKMDSPTDESTVSVLFLLSSKGHEFIEIVIQEVPGSFSYGGSIPLLWDGGKTSLKNFDPQVEDFEIYGRRLITTDEVALRSIWAMNDYTGIYNQLSWK